MRIFNFEPCQIFILPFQNYLVLLISMADDQTFEFKWLENSKNQTGMNFGQCNGNDTSK